MKSPTTDKDLGIRVKGNWNDEKFRDLRHRAEEELERYRSKRTKTDHVPKYNIGDKFVVVSEPYKGKRRYAYAEFA